MNNLLFIIPHPDDEIVGSCSIIRNTNAMEKKFFYFLLPMEFCQKIMFGLEKDQIEKMVKIRKKELKLSLKMLGLEDYFFQNIHIGR